MMVVHGHVRNGAIVLDEAVALPEGAPVQVMVAGEPAGKPAEGEIPTLFERLKDVVGSIDDLPEDSSINLDHYLYGTAKR
jgi:hypothetical protein